MSSAFVYAAVRTPFGRFGGALAAVRPGDLAATAVTAVTGALAQAPELDHRRDRLEVSLTKGALDS
jgi:acetyl-CoA acyltransferase